jgi:16S rRNA (guanine527-N7)-methyltransferase
VNCRHEPLPTDVGGLPDLPTECHDVLDIGLASIGLTINDHVRAAILDHLRLLLAWTASINLTSVRDPVAAVRVHILDSLAAAPLLRERQVTGFVDIGSGGGYPGLPLAIALPAARSVLVESVGKKARFLQTTVAALGLESTIRVFPGRAEDLVGTAARGSWPAVVGRAIGSLSELVELAMPLLSRNGVLVAWKRWPLDDELTAAVRALQGLGGGPAELHPVQIEGLTDHVLVVAPKLRPTPPGYPRNPAERRRRPW